MSTNHPGHKPLVLIVDDDPFMRLLARDALVQFGLRIEEAGDGVSGLDAIKKSWPDVVLLDVLMPGMDGFTMCRELRRLEGANPIPILMLTGLNDLDSITKAYDAGATDFITKPIAWEILGHRVKYMLNASRMMRSFSSSEMRLTNAQRIAAVGSWDWDIRTDTVDYSAEIYRLLGATHGTIPNTYQGFLNCIYPEDRRIIDELISGALKRGAPYRVDHRILRHDGMERIVHGQAEIVFDRNGVPLSMHGTLQDITERKQIEIELRRSKEQLREIVAYQDRLKEEERTRIAREIHDELGGLLTGIKSYLSFTVETVEQAGMVPDVNLVGACKLADHAMDTVRRVIADLRPSVLDQLGLWAALEWYASQVEERTGLRCVVSIDSYTAEQLLDTERSTAIFRIVQEALTNVVRHACATMVTIQAVCQDSSVTIVLRDDGTGISAVDLIDQDSWGVTGMYERARHFGGDLIIDSSDGRGTTVVVRIPVRGDNE